MKENDVLFVESQKFSQWWLWVMLLALNGFSAFALYQQLYRGISFGTNPMSDGWLIITSILMFLLSLWFFTFRLETKVKKEGIYVRFFPLHLKTRFFSWDHIAKLYVKEYSALKDFGGWGLRIGFFGKGIAYNISGNQGLQLELNNGKKVLIGTNKAPELTAVLKDIGVVGG